MVNILISQVCDIGNKGDQAIFKSEIVFLRKIFTNVTISASTLWSYSLITKVESNIRVYSPLVDLKIRGKEVPLLLFPVVFIMQVFFSILSALSMKYGLCGFYRSDLIKSIKDADLVLSSGHQPFNEGSFHSKTLWSKLGSIFILFWGVMDVLVAKKIFRKSFATFPQSVGPFNTLWGRIFSKFIFGNIDILNLREDVSISFIRGYRVKKIHVLRDMAFLFNSQTEKSSSTYNHPLLGVSPCFYLGISQQEKENYIRVSAKVLDFLKEKYGFNIIFLPSQTTSGKSMLLEKIPDDQTACELIIRQMVNKTGVALLRSSSVDEFCAALSHLDLLVSTRMHPTILASKVPVPFVELIYEYKQTGLLKVLGLSYVGLPTADLSVEELVNKIEYVWKNKDKIYKHLTEVVPSIEVKTRNSLKQSLTNLI